MRGRLIKLLIIPDFSAIMLAVTNAKQENVDVHRKTGKRTDQKGLQNNERQACI